MELQPCDLESLSPERHLARIAWAYVAQADLSWLYAEIKAVDGGSGRTPIAPEILLALWLYATVEGVGSVRASARAASFRRRRTLEGCLDEARRHGEAVKRQIEDDPGVRTRKQQAARERDEKVRRALEPLPKPEQIKEKQGKPAEEARASTAGAEATVMKMGDGDGGLRPAYRAVDHRHPKPSDRTVWSDARRMAGQREFSGA